MVKYTPIQTLSAAEKKAAHYVSRRIWTFEAYINAEELSVERHEFNNGKRITMIASTQQHSLIGANLCTAINNGLNNRNDEDTYVYNCAMNVYMPDSNKSVYPDLSIIQGAALMKHPHVIMNPILLAEVLSNSTEAYDRGDKFKNYKSLPSFREYVLVSQNKPLVEVFYRENPLEKVWKLSKSEGLDATVELRSIGCILKMKDIYRGVFK
jgi:Uma2 family endonuclease